MWMTRVAINHPVFATMVMVALTVLGIFSYQRLRVEAMPDVRPPFVAVKVDYPGASPEQFENDVAKPIENAVNQVAGVKRLLSASYEGFGWTWIEFRLNVDQVVTALKNANVAVPVGTVSNRSAEAIVRVDGRVSSPKDFGRIIVARKGGVPILLSQIAEVVDGERERVSLARINGSPAISFYVFKAQDANIVEVGENLKRAAEGVRKQLPAGAELRLLRATSDFVERSADNVKYTIIEGGLLTVLIVFLFLGSWRSTIITGLALPISVVATFIALYAFGFTLNYMTLMALSLCIGLLIDDAIVVRENIVRHILMGKNHYAAAREGTDEIGLAVLATTFSIVAVFVPIAFMSGIVGKFFFPFGITVAAAVLVSLFVSFTLDPMLSAVWRDPPEGARNLPVVGPVVRRFDLILERVHALYDQLLRAALTHRVITLAIALASLGVALPLAKIVGTEMMPQADESFTSLRLTMPVGSSLDYADERVQRVEQALREFREIEVIDTSIGTEGGKDTARINLKLVPRSD